MTSSDQSNASHSELRNCVNQMLQGCDVGQDVVFIKLQNIGVSSVSNMTYLEKADLKDVLKHIHIRKFLKQIHGLPKESAAAGMFRL